MINDRVVNIYRSAQNEDNLGTVDLTNQLDNASSPCYLFMLLHNLYILKKI